MTVSELIEELQQMEPDAEVRFAYNYGNYWRTTVAADIKYVDDGYIKWSDYHSMDTLEESEDGEPAVILSATRIS